MVARTPLAVRVTALDLSADPPQRVLLALPDEGLPAPRVAVLRERFRRLAHLAHPNIPSYRPGSTRGASWCVSDCIDGETLADVIEQLGPEPLQQDEIDTIVQKLRSALEAAHALEISHGALCLENVIVTPDLDIRLTGFDLGDAAGRLEFTPSADITALESLADELEGMHALPEVDVVPDLPRQASRLLPDELPPRRRHRTFGLAAVAVLVVAIVAINPSELVRLVRSAADPGAATATVPDELPLEPVESGELALVSDAAVEAPEDPPEISAASLAEGSAAARIDEAIDDPAPTPAPSDPIAADEPAEIERDDPERSEPAAVQLRFSPAGLVAVSEGDGTARLTLRAGRNTEVIWWSADSSARRDSDYVDPGLTSASVAAASAVDIVVPLVADGIAESDEVFDVYASAVENGKQVGVPASASVRIVDDD